MKKFFTFLTLLLIISFSAFSKGKTDQEPVEEIIPEVAEIPPEPEVLLPKYTLRTPEGDPVPLKESWGYVMQSRKDEYNKEIPLTDVCFFAAEVNTYGELTSVPKRSMIDIGKARAHLVVVCDSRSLSHFVINPEFSVRKELMNQIVKAADGYDGVQIDFEYIPARDRKHFLTFIADLRYKLKNQGKMLSVCVPARFKRLSEDVYPYSDIANYCDRVFVMAYDEHWSTSKPGAIASVEWCQKILDYATKEIPPKKLIMGIPFYGRTWSNTTTSGAWYFSGTSRIMTENGVEDVTYENDIPTYQYDQTVHITGYFNDTYSVLTLCRLYQNAGLTKMGFWRIGQEDPEFWNWIQLQ